MAAVPRPWTRPTAGWLSDVAGVGATAAAFGLLHGRSLGQLRAERARVAQLHKVTRRQRVRSAHLQKQRKILQRRLRGARFDSEILATLGLSRVELTRRHAQDIVAGGGLPLTQKLSADAAVQAVRLLIDSEDVLWADSVAVAYEVAEDLPLRYKRLLGSQLRLRGYLERGIRYSALAARSGLDRDRVTHEWRQGEVDVLSGKFAPQCPPMQVEPRSGRVLHVVGTSVPLSQSGYTIRTHYIARAQLGSAVEPHVVTHAGVGEVENHTVESVDGVPYHRMPGIPRGEGPLDGWLQENTARLGEVVAKVQPQVLHAHSDFLNAVTAQAVGSAAGIPVIYEARGFWEETWLSRNAELYGWTDLDDLEQQFGLPDAYTWRKRREEDCRMAVDRVVTLARVMADRITEAGVPETRVSLAPNAVDTQAFPPVARDEALAQRLGIGSDELIVGYISSLVEYEGIEVLVDAVHRASKRASVPLTLLIVGDGPERERLEKLCDELSLPRAVFTGRVPHDEVLHYYGLIDLFVVPRHPMRVCELVTPLKPFEAFATGRTVVMSDVAALAEIADDSGAAQLFRAGDPESLAEVLVDLAEEPRVRSAMARGGADWVARSRTWERNHQRYLDLYRDLGVVTHEPAVAVGQ